MLNIEYSHSSRRVVQKTLDENVVKIWNSIILTSNTLKIDRGSITNCCSRKRNTAGGWFWMYYEDYVQHDPNEKWREIELGSRKSEYHPSEEFSCIMG